MLKLVFGIVISIIMSLPGVSVANPVVIGPGSSQMVTVTGFTTQENTIEFTANNERYVIDDLFADSPEGTKLIADLEQLIQSKQKVDIDYAVVQPDDKNQYNCKVALFIGSYGSPAIPNSNKVNYVFDNGRSYLKIDPLSDYRFAMINSHINTEKGRMAKDTETMNMLREQNRTAEANKPVPQQKGSFSPPEFKAPYDIPSTAVLQAFIYNLVGVSLQVANGNIRFNKFRVTNNYTRKFNDETVYVIDTEGVIDILEPDNAFNKNVQNRVYKGEIPFLKRGSKWFAFNEFSKKWLELPSQ